MTTRDDQSLLDPVIDALRAGGQVLLSRFDPKRRPPTTLNLVVEAIDANDAAVLSALRPRLEELRPQARWVEDELESGPLPDGEWWVVDPAEGNINHVQGLAEWGLTATLVRDNQPVLTAAYLPLQDRLFTAVRGQGTHLNGERLHVSQKSELQAAIVGTGQARPGEEARDLHRLGLSVPAVLARALVLRVTVPATLPLLDVAAGHLDAFWQFSAVRSGLMSGALLVQEAGGRVTDMLGQPWSLQSQTFLASAPGIHGELLDVLAPMEGAGA
ncbi:inositol monophosphatase family protein [Deinococcus altitudinis]|uniref:inositol monophosphatase family protein n=1 Tax=Deinococcus altitudinis TaxID=468914 RepID=UPI0038912FB7